MNLAKETRLLVFFNSLLAPYSFAESLNVLSRDMRRHPTTAAEQDPPLVLDRIHHGTRFPTYIVGRTGREYIAGWKIPEQYNLLARQLANLAQAVLEGKVEQIEAHLREALRSHQSPRIIVKRLHANIHC